MRRALLAAAALAFVLLATGAIWSFPARAGEVDTTVTTLLAIGTVLGLGTLIVWVLAERRPDGLRVAEGTRLPTPAWWGPVLLVGTFDLAGGLLASLPMVVVGGALIVGAFAGWGMAANRAPAAPTTENAIPDRGAVVAARRIQRFAERHAAPTGNLAVTPPTGDPEIPAPTGNLGITPPTGDPEIPAPTGNLGVSAALEDLGLDAVRIVLVGADGTLGDLVVRERARAEAAVAMAGATIEDPTARDLVTRIRTGPYEWRRMAGLQLGGRR